MCSISFGRTHVHVSSLYKMFPIKENFFPVMPRLVESNPFSLSFSLFFTIFTQRAVSVNTVYFSPNYSMFGCNAVTSPVDCSHRRISWTSFAFALCFISIVSILFFIYSPSLCVHRSLRNLSRPTFTEREDDIERKKRERERRGR